MALPRVPTLTPRGARDVLLAGSPAAIAAHSRSLASTGTNEFTFYVVFDRYQPTSRRQLDVAIPGAAGTISPANTASTVLTLEYQPVGVVLSSSIDPTGDLTYFADSLDVTATFSAAVSSTIPFSMLSVQTSDVLAPNVVTVTIQSAVATSDTEYVFTVRFVAPVHDARVDISVLPGYTEPHNAQSSNRISFLYKPPTMQLTAETLAQSHVLAYSVTFASPVANLGLEYFQYDSDYPHIAVEMQVMTGHPSGDASIPTASWLLELTVLPTSAVIANAAVTVRQASIVGGSASPTLAMSTSSASKL